MAAVSVRFWSFADRLTHCVTAMFGYAVSCVQIFSIKMELARARLPYRQSYIKQLIGRVASDRKFACAVRTQPFP